MTTGSGRGGARHRRLAAAVLTAAALLPAQAAQAGVETYFNGNIGSGGKVVGPQHSMTSNRVGNNYGASVGVGAAALQNGNMYGNWILGTAYACHPYGGGNLLSPLLLNNHSNTQSMFGNDYFGVDRYC